jgi:primary-amine oxidase
MRIGPEIDGPDNTVLEIDAVGLPIGPGNEHGNAIVARKTAIANEREARRACDPATARTWKIINPNVTNRFGESDLSSARPRRRRRRRSPAARPAGPASR